MAKKSKEADVKIVYYDVANQTTRSGSAAAVSSKYPTKDTVNLCMKERKGISYEIFFLLFIVIFAVLIIVEFFGVYRPYLEVERKEAQLAEQQAQLEQIYSEMQDREQVRNDYRQYNYENFPRQIVDREEVLALLERSVFPKGKITSVSVSGNNLILAVAGVSRADVDKMQAEIREDKIVQSILVSRTDFNSNDAGEEVATVNMSILFKDASEEGN